jgi:hypothetical protein
MRKRQSGQALVGVLVVMLILFALAGAVTLATSVLLRQRATMRTAYSDDFTAQNAAADAISQVAGSSSLCRRVTPASFPRLSSPEPPLLISLPNTFPSPVADTPQAAYCRRIDQVASTLPSYLYTNVSWDNPPFSSCVKPVPLSSQQGKKVSIFFNARRVNTTVDPYAYVDGNGSNGSSNCSSTRPSLSSLPCGYAMDHQTAPPVIQVLLSCDLTSGSSCGSGSSCYLHIANVSSSLGRVFIVDQTDPSPSSSSIYLLASATGLRSGQDYEETVLLVSVSTNTNRLLYEARLP